jgi:hypothetical protein
MSHQFLHALSEVATTADLAARFAREVAGRRRWLMIGLALAIVIVGVVYLWPSFKEFPMDDAYIHLVYAENLAEHGGLFFNTPDEDGVGSSSILWVLLIAAGHKVGVPGQWLMKGLGLLSLIVVAESLFILLASVWRPSLAAAASLLAALSGNMLWFALNGMETMLFLALGLVALLHYRRERWAALGVTLGLLTLTRPEGLALLLAIAGVELLRGKGPLLERLRRKPGRNLTVVAGWCLAVSAPWFLYLLARTSQPLPTSGTAKQFSSSLVFEQTLEAVGGPAIFSRLLPLLYVLLWIVYLLVFVLGGMSLPQPRLVLDSFDTGIPYAVSWWSLVSWAVALALLAAAARRLWQRDRWSGWIQGGPTRPLAVLCAWALVHNAAYMAFLPVPGTASRYGALNHLLLWVLLVLGLSRFGSRPRLRLVLGGCLLVIAVANTAYWNRVYDANLDHMKQVRIAAARFLRDGFPEDAVCAAFDVGALRYYGERPLVDLGGLIEPEVARWYRAEAVDRYLVEQGVTCLAVPGRAGRQEEGWFDLVAILGLDETARLRLAPVRVFEIDHERWLLGYLPTTNYQASVVVYRLLPGD